MSELMIEASKLAAAASQLGRVRVGERVLTNVAIDQATFGDPRVIERLEEVRGLTQSAARSLDNATIAQMRALDRVAGSFEAVDGQLSRVSR